MAGDQTRLLITFFECQRLSPYYSAGGVSFGRSIGQTSSARAQPILYQMKNKSINTLHFQHNFDSIFHLTIFFSVRYRLFSNQTFQTDTFLHFNKRIIWSQFEILSF